MPADIAKCSGLGCPLKDTCYRHNMEGAMMQRYTAPVYNSKKKKCLIYWEDKNDG